MLPINKCKPLINKCTVKRNYSSEHVIYKKIPPTLNVSDLLQHTPLHCFLLISPAPTEQQQCPEEPQQKNWVFLRGMLGQETTPQISNTILHQAARPCLQVMSQLFLTTWTYMTPGMCAGCSLNTMGWNASMYSLGVGFKLTDEQISMLDGHTDRFLAAGYQGREQIVEKAFLSFKKAWPKGVKFHKAVLRTVHV